MDSNEIIPNLRRVMEDVRELRKHAGAVAGIQPDTQEGATVITALARFDHRITEIATKVRLIEETGIGPDFVTGTDEQIRELTARVNDLSERVGQLEKIRLVAIEERLDRLEGNNGGGVTPERKQPAKKPARKAAR